jgi:hypothetical protein
LIRRIRTIRVLFLGLSERLRLFNAINEIHQAQAHNYLAASNLRLAIILNPSTGSGRRFGAPSLEYKRIVN